MNSLAVAKYTCYITQQCYITNKAGPEASRETNRSTEKMSGLDPLITSPEAFECGKMQRFNLKKRAFPRTS